MIQRASNNPNAIEDLASALLILSEARWYTTELIRRLLNQRAQQAAIALDSLIEVEHQQTAFELDARGLGDVIAVLHFASTGFCQTFGLGTAGTTHVRDFCLYPTP